MASKKKPPKPSGKASEKAKPESKDIELKEEELAVLADTEQEEVADSKVEEATAEATEETKAEEVKADENNLEEEAQPEEVKPEEVNDDAKPEEQSDEVSSNTPQDQSESFEVDNSNNEIVESSEQEAEIKEELIEAESGIDSQDSASSDEDKVVQIKPEEKEEVVKTSPSKFKLFVSRYKLPIIIASIVILIALAAVITVLVMNKNLVRISSAEDFANKDTKGKTTYVITKDITVEGDLTIPNGMNIDLNKYTLTINGNLIYGNDAGDNEIYIGDKKGPLFLDNGALVADSINFNSPNATLSLHSPITANGNYTLKTLKIANDYNASNSVTINASQYVTIKGDLIVGNDGSLVIVANTTTIENDVEISGSGASIDITSQSLTLDADLKAAIASITDCGTEDNKGTINGSITGALDVTNSYLVIGKDSTINSISADNLSTLDISGTVTTSLTGGLLIIYQSGSVCPLTSDSLTVHIYEDSTITQINNVPQANILFFVKLNAPRDITVNQEGASIVCYVAEVANADEYVVTIAGQEIRSATNVIDITAYITEAGDHSIIAKAVSSNAQLLDSATISYTYTYNIKLATPSISIDDSDGYKVEFEAVPFATSYKYTINGTEYTFVDLIPDSDVSIDITDKITTPGVYAIKIRAYGKSEDAYTPSETALTTVIKYSNLETVKLGDDNISIVRAGTALNLNWDRVANANYYSVYVDDVLVTKTRNNAFSWTLGDLNDGAQIKIITEGYSYYITSPAATTTYNYETLDAPVVSAPYVTGDNVTINWTAIDNATEYEIYLDGTLVDTTTTTSYTIAHSPATSGVYTVKAIAQFFNCSTSAPVTVPNPALTAPIIASNIVDSGSGDEVVINWVAVANATSYELYEVGNEVALDTTSGTSFTFPHTGSGSYYVKAIAAGYTSADSNTVVVADVSP